MTTGLGTARVLCVDGEPLVAGALGRLCAEAGLSVVGVTLDYAATAEKISSAKPTVAVVGLDFRDASGFEMIRLLRRDAPDLPILVYATTDTRAYMHHFKSLGCRGFVSRFEPVENVVSGIRSIAIGGLFFPQLPNEETDTNVLRRLSPTEFEVFHFVSQGMANREIAKSLHRSVKTVETYRTRIKEKLLLGSGAELARFAFDCLAARRVEK